MKSSFLRSLLIHPMEMVEGVGAEEVTNLECGGYHRFELPTKGIWHYKDNLNLKSDTIHHQTEGFLTVN